MTAAPDVFAELCRLRAARRPCALCTVVRAAGSTPRKEAARMLVGADGATLGTIGGGRVEKEVTDAAQGLLGTPGARPQLLRFHLTRELAMCCGGEMEIFVEPFQPDPILLVCGGGHVAHALVPLCRRVGFEPWVIEDLDTLRTESRFPDAGRLIDSFDPRDWRDVPLDGSTYVVIVTRDHQQDQALLERLVERDVAYLGLIGSRRKVALFRQRLMARGISEERLDRVHAPIGLNIGAETPEEIAVAITAELIAVRAARRGPRPPAAPRGRSEGPA